jgi:hypothetical protein
MRTKLGSNVMLIRLNYYINFKCILKLFLRIEAVSQDLDGTPSKKRDWD